MSRSEIGVRSRIDKLNTSDERLFAEAQQHISDAFRGSAAFTYSISARRETLTSFEHAQALCFVTKCLCLPDPENLKIRKDAGAIYPKNMDAFRHLLNEFRPIIQNVRDSTHHSHIHRLCSSKLTNRDPSVDLSISVQDESGADITDIFRRLLNQKHKAICWVLKRSEFDYIYNGILQHSDQRHTERYERDYSSGELHYIFLSHAQRCAFVKGHLWWHFQMLSALANATMGPL